jgi:hypothetical protein
MAHGLYHPCSALGASGTVLHSTGAGAMRDGMRWQHALHHVRSARKQCHTGFTRSQLQRLAGQASVVLSCRNDTQCYKLYKFVCQDNK